MCEAHFAKVFLARHLVSALMLQQLLVLVHAILRLRGHSSRHGWFSIVIGECLRLLDGLKVLLKRVDICRICKVVDDQLSVLFDDTLVFDEILHRYEVVTEVADLVKEFLLALREEIVSFFATTHRPLH